MQDGKMEEKSLAVCLFDFMLKYFHRYYPSIYPVPLQLILFRVIGEFQPSSYHWASGQVQYTLHRIPQIKSSTKTDYDLITQTTC